MPRKLRIEYPGAMYHVMSRGDRREDIYLDDVDRHDFLKSLAEACPKTSNGCADFHFAQRSSADHGGSEETVSRCSSRVHPQPPFARQHALVFRLGRDDPLGTTRLPGVIGWAHGCVLS